ncbi:MAG: hypothetical protein CM15mP90_5450 [Actinomycetota bacterium]|nr:MAG: hypothetical protein CM15mP90_5450 [Actinomycetota bacterium]
MRFLPSVDCPVFKVTLNPPFNNFIAGWLSIVTSLAPDFILDEIHISSGI